ncbi:hypothetical protein [Streptomyces sp. NBRC 110611]|uniref:hypothetical protein n=1 Tax=Streptomyces sp. NBRC 110611 TaxID=1621259 RepID=UPI000A6C4217|nr:hypothetical protein [Streptomyces sp. NBRC 110611]
MSHQQQQQSDDDSEPTWGSMPPREKALAAFGMTGLGLGVLAFVVLALLLGVLVVAAVSRGLIEIDGPGPLIWAAVLCLPCGLLASVLTLPLRLLLRLVPVSTALSRSFSLSRSPSLSPKARRGAEALLSLVSTFLAALFVAAFTPGLRVQHPWLPALLAALLVALANVAVDRFSHARQPRPSSR